MLESEMIYQDQTLYITLKGRCQYSDIKQLQRKISHIINQYGIEEIIVDRKQLVEFAYDDFNGILDDYEASQNFKIFD